jgi:hypothetical protein
MAVMVSEQAGKKCMGHRGKMLDITIDYRWEGRKKDDQSRGEIGTVIDRPRLPLSGNSDHRPKENKPFSQEMHLKILLLSRGLKLSNSKPGSRVSALHFFVK